MILSNGHILRQAKYRDKRIILIGLLVLLILTHVVVNPARQEEDPYGDQVF